MNKAEALQMGSVQYTDKVGDVVYAWVMQVETANAEED